MKTTQRSIPNDIFSVEDKDRTIQICTHGQLISVRITSNGGLEASYLFTFHWFYSHLQDILKLPPPPSPSEADKTPTAANGSAGSGTSEPINVVRYNWTQNPDGKWMICDGHHPRCEPCQYREATEVEIAEWNRRPELHSLHSYPQHNRL